MKKNGASQSASGPGSESLTESLISMIKDKDQ
jgi:hypothetical protein